jgi:hypothetical protein
MGFMTISFEPVVLMGAVVTEIRAAAVARLEPVTGMPLGLVPPGPDIEPARDGTDEQPVGVRPARA